MPRELLALVTWKTRYSDPLIDRDVATLLVSVLPELGLRVRATVIELAIVADHVHCVVRLPLSYDAPALAQRLKGASSHRVNSVLSRSRPLRWASGYDLRSISPSALPDVRRYLDAQGDRHATELLGRWSAPAEGGPSGPFWPSPGFSPGEPSALERPAVPRRTG